MWVEFVVALVLILAPRCFRRVFIYVVIFLTLYLVVINTNHEIYVVVIFPSVGSIMKTTDHPSDRLTDSPDQISEVRISLSSCHASCFFGSPTNHSFWCTAIEIRTTPIHRNGKHVVNNTKEIVQLL
ncbi:hypothetical protein OS493_027477 [Desmophyllum pertusum]|uniref:Uncharacterized protein n=1 Tax=Desmophyllum pertusum TaxID=174260 RepID=A0A9W9Y9G2_9CNID|nr:hypothetical protein OS493_027477 [Desmophyllum pertusum]